MDGESTNDVIMIGEDAPTEFSVIPLLMEFEEPETVNPVTVKNEPVEIEPEQRREPIAELAVPQAVSTAATTAVIATRLGSGEEDNPTTAATTFTAIRLGSGADENPTTSAGDVKDENMDRPSRRNRSRGRRSRRGRSRRSRSRRGRSRRSRSRSRSLRSRSRSVDDDGDFYVQIADDEILAYLEAGNKRGGQETARGGRRAKRVEITGRRGRKATYESRVSGKAIGRTRGGRKSARGSHRGRKTTECGTARTIWSERLRPISHLRNKKSKAN
ncbi:unnamed protein product [Macrosiphum euphorbiae]|uniref:Uncharacterized protein n=1 Tax=Macrosiphum euphorbiae TaxID=13131 RepID=A0AAV0WQK3_9HEMI|nr:unnamed protein product [Macrosiphum euphorbiae]